MDLLAALREARRPYEEERRREEARRREEEAERQRLRTDPEALRSHLRRWENRSGIERLGERFATALAMTLKRDDELQEAERRALRALAGLFADPLQLRLADREPSARERETFEDLAEHHRTGQLRRIADLAERHGEGPALREARRRLEAGELLTIFEGSWLEQRAADDRRSREEQERLACDYLSWREEEARRLAKTQGIARRLRSGPEDFIDQIDRRSLRRCKDCGEIAYPDPERAGHGRGHRHVASRCHFCGAQGTLGEIDGEGAGR